MKENLFFLFFHGIIVVGLSSASMAEKSGSKAAPAVSGRQMVFIDPETGEILPSVEQEAIATASQTVEIDVPPQEIFYQNDGSVRIDFNGKYMLPLYGRINSEGTLSLSHGHSEKEE